MTESGSVMSKHKSLFHIIQNPREAPNLKSNIFDKMLSNEMFSIKQQIYDKSNTNLSQIYITFKNSIATPTLELKQRWNIEKPSSHLEIKRPKEGISTNLHVYSINADNELVKSKEDEKEYDDINKLNDSINSKSLGVRSFDAMSVHHLESQNNHQHSPHKCTCMKSNPYTTCTFRCSEHKQKTCTLETGNYVTLHPQGTRDMMSYTYYPYYVYSTMFLEVTTDSAIIYDHPEAMNEIKLPKHKYSQTKKPNVDDNSYIVNDDDTYEKEYLNNDYSYNEKPKITKSPRKKHKKGKKDRQDKIYFIDYKEENSISKSDTFDNGYLQVLDTDKFVEDVVEDLKMYYSDAVVKDCYCSLSPHFHINKTFIICLLLVFITTIKWYLSCFVFILMLSIVEICFVNFHVFHFFLD